MYDKDALAVVEAAEMLKTTGAEDSKTVVRRTPSH